MKFKVASLVTALCLMLVVSVSAYSQAAPAAPPPLWTGNFGFGLALTNGNTDTKNVNLSAGIVRDPKKRSVIRVNAAYLRGDKDDVLIVDRATLVARDEINLTPRLFAFGQGEYLKDTFKQIKYVLSPTAGVGYKLVQTDMTQLSVDTGVGGIWERDLGQPTRSSGAYNWGERFAYKPSKTATVTQSVAAIYKTNHWSDSLYNFSLGLAASVTSHSELKIELLDSYKNRPNSPTLKKNDTAVVTAIVVKF